MALAHFAAAAFCIYGFMAGFEPTPHANLWRIGYVIIFVAAITGGFWWWRKGA
jgi:hypothetical protein